MNDSHQQDLRNLVAAYHKLGVAVRELSIKTEDLDRRITRMEQTVFHGSNSLSTELAILRMRVTEQIEACRETRKTHDLRQVKHIQGTSTVRAALITGGVSLLAALIAAFVAIFLKG